jgi:hypothetical protein
MLDELGPLDDTRFAGAVSHQSEFARNRRL